LEGAWVLEEEEEEGGGEGTGRGAVWGWETEEEDEVEEDEIEETVGCAELTGDGAAMSVRQCKSLSALSALVSHPPRTGLLTYPEPCCGRT